MKKYLITGGCGFIGSHLAERLLALGHKVRILDDLSTGKKEFKPPQAELMIGSVTDKKMLRKALEEVDGCFHLAAIVSVEKSVRQWSFSHVVNQTALVLLLESLVEMGHKIPVLFASSAAVYGASRELPLKEQAFLDPLSPYGIDKAGCESQAAIAWRLHQIPTIGCRLFNVYGLRQDPLSPYSGVIARFVSSICRGEPITLFGGGTQQRDFIHVSDVVRFFADAMQKVEGKQIFNLCTGVGTSINDLIAMIENISQKKALKTYAPPRSGDIEISIGSPLAALSALNFKAEVSLDEGLAELVEATYRKELCVGVGF